jgi:hypothetical protein
MILQQGIFLRYDLGVDGLFSDFPGSAATARYLHKILESPAFARCLTEGSSKRGNQNQDCLDSK